MDNRSIDGWLIGSYPQTFVDWLPSNREKNSNVVLQFPTCMQMFADTHSFLLPAVWSPWTYSRLDGIRACALKRTPYFDKRGRSG